MNSRNYLALLPLVATSAYAELTPLDDASMEQMVGQAYIEMESFENAGTQYNRITFGQTIKIQSNADEVVFGEGYDQATNTLTGSTSDVDISMNDVSLGYIDSNTGDIIPMTFKNPYLEFATDVDNNMIGFRLGFGEAEGKLQADFNAFSGNIGITVGGQTAALYSGIGGIQTNSRATMLGVGGSCTDSSNCWDLNNFNSLDVGDSSGSGPTGDFFLSFQTNGSVQWQLADSSMQTATEGFFMNIPTSNNVANSGASTGTAAFSTEFIDRGVGRFTAQ